MFVRWPMEQLNIRTHMAWNDLKVLNDGAPMNLALEYTMNASNASNSHYMTGSESFTYAL